MIAILKPGVSETQIENLKKWLLSKNVDVHISRGEFQTVMGLIGDVSRIDSDLLEGLDIVEAVRSVSDPFKSANRKFHPDDTVINVRGRKIGGGNFQLIAGPCSVETPEQILIVAQSVKEAGAGILRGGAFKPRTSPYDFQGLGETGLKHLIAAGKETDLPIVTEIMNTEHLPMFDDVDIIQVGARNMQNFELLKELGKTNKPILLKRGLANTLKELLMSAEYIMSEGNEEVILCERGVRTFETFTRNTLDLSAIPVLHNLTHLPVIADPSHGTGHAYLVQSMAMASAAAGADGIMIEVHNDPPRALCDGPQSLTPEQFKHTAQKIMKIREVL